MHIFHWKQRFWFSSWDLLPTPLRKGIPRQAWLLQTRHTDANFLRTFSAALNCFASSEMRQLAWDWRTVRGYGDKRDRLHSFQSSASQMRQTEALWHSHSLLGTCPKAIVEHRMMSWRHWNCSDHMLICISHARASYICDHHRWVGVQKGCQGQRIEYDQTQFACFSSSDLRTEQSAWSHTDTRRKPNVCSEDSHFQPSPLSSIWVCPTDPCSTRWQLLSLRLEWNRKKRICTCTFTENWSNSFAPSAFSATTTWIADATPFLDSNLFLTKCAATNT